MNQYMTPRTYVLKQVQKLLKNKKTDIDISIENHLGRSQKFPSDAIDLINTGYRTITLKYFIKDLMKN